MAVKMIGYMMDLDCISEFITFLIFNAMSTGSEWSQVFPNYKGLATSIPFVHCSHVICRYRPLCHLFIDYT